MFYAQPRIRPKDEMHKLLRAFEIRTDHLISARRPNLVIVNNLLNCGRPFKQISLKLKESEKRDEYLHFARELENVWNRKAMVIQIVNLLRSVQSPKNWYRDWWT